MKPTVLILAFFFCTTHSYRILFVFPLPGKSHNIIANALARGLAEKGHDVTMVSTVEEKNPPKNGTYKNVLLSGLDDDSKKPEIMTNLLRLESMNTFLYIPMINQVGLALTKNALEHPNFQKLLQSNEQFDLVIIDQFNDDALKVLAYHYKTPLVLLFTAATNGWVNPLVGNPSPPSYIPEFFFEFTHDMTFWQRLNNWLYIVLADLNQRFIFFPAQNKLMHEYFPDAPDLDDLLYNASIVFVNSHESISQAVPHVPCMIDIGGIHIKPPKELPSDLKKFMDNAKEGVIYFSMGSNIKPSQISREQIRAIVGAFSKIKQKVLWKWDEDHLEGKPDNVFLSKWFPQPDILAHPNTKLFITHGGLLSTTETVYHGVPILAFPVFADQKMNAARAQMYGYGLTLKFSEISEEKIDGALDKLLNDPQYKNNVKRRSELLKDRPVQPLDLAIYWTEYVIRHKGAPHLKVAGLDLPWYKYLLLDVISFVIFITLSVLAVLYVVLKKIFSSCVKRIKKVKTN